jgi:hypothetical protein
MVLEVVRNIACCGGEECRRLAPVGGVRVLGRDVGRDRIPREMPDLDPRGGHRVRVDAASLKTKEN